MPADPDRRTAELPRNRDLRDCESAVGFGADQRDKTRKRLAPPGSRARTDTHHVVADRLEDLTDLLRSVGERDEAEHVIEMDPRLRHAAKLNAGTGMDAPNLLSQPSPGIQVPSRDFQ